MNVSLNLSPGQLSKLRNGHSIRVSRAMFSSGIDMIIDPMNYNNMMKKLERGKGAIISMSSAEIKENKIEGTGLLAGSGNKSGKISRRKKAGKWKDFAVETARDGIDLGRYGHEQYKEATNPLASEGKKAIKGLSKMFGGEMEMEGDGFIQDVKKGYKKKVKNSALGKALRESAASAVGDVYDMGAKELSKNKYGKPISQYMKDKKGSNVHRLTGVTGLGGLRVAGDGRMRPAVVRPDFSKWELAVEKSPGIRPDPRNLKKYFKNVKGKGLKMSGSGTCQGCGMQNDKFIFQDIAL